MYYPILRAKMGELLAIKELSLDIKKSINPILQIIPDTNTNRKVPITYWNTLAKRINDLEGVNLVLLDNSFIVEDLTSFKRLINNISSKIRVQPVIHPNSSQEYIDYIKLNFPKNVFVRFKVEFTTSRLINDTIDYIKREFNIDESNIDVLLDFGNVEFFQIETFTNSFKSIVDNTNSFTSFNNIVISSGCFPKDVSNFKIDSINFIKRVELVLYDRCKEVYSEISFSDYANIHPEFNPYATAFLGSCTLKYTSDEDYIIFRGAKPDNHPEGNDQYINKCVELVSKDYYAGNNYSAGDKYIYECSERENGPGNALTWVKVTQNHHFTKVINQLNND